jgi:hypothetical protein
MAFRAACGNNLPATLSIRTILQGGADNRQVLISYVADPSGNAIGPFAAGATVHLRTRVTNSNGTTTGSVRTLTIA